MKKNNNNDKINPKQTKNIKEAIKNDEMIEIMNIFKVWQGDKKGRVYEKEYTHNNITMKIKSYDHLTAKDRRIFQGILCLCTNSTVSRTIKNTAKSSVANTLRNQIFTLDDNHDVSTIEDVTVIEQKQNHEPFIYVRCTATALNKTCNLSTGGGSYKRLCDYLDRLSGVTLFINDNGVRSSMRLLTYSTDKDTGELLISINTKSASAILGTKSNQFSFENMDTFKQLKDAESVIIHGYLSNRVKQNGKAEKKIRLDTICSKVFDGFDDLSEENESELGIKNVYRSRTRKALKAINLFNDWDIRLVKEFYGRSNANKKVEFAYISRR